MKKWFIVIDDKEVEYCIEGRVIDNLLLIL